MKRFTLQLILFCLPLIILGYLFQNYIDKGIRKTGLMYYPDWNRIIESSINANLIIQGNSRAWLQISPLVLDSALHLDSYNLGLNGYTFKMQYYRFLLYTTRNKKPKYIVQSIDCNTTLPYMDDLFEYEQFLPYLNDTIIRKAVNEYHFFDQRDYCIPMYKYTHSFLSKDLIYLGLKANLLGTVAKEHKYKGFESRDLKWSDADFNNTRMNHINGYRRSVDPLTNQYFDKFLKYCYTDGIKVIFVFTPEYKEFQSYQLDRDSIRNIFAEYSTRYNIAILDYSDDSICFDRNNFYDSFHLNSKGVEKFNVQLASDLKKIIAD